MDMRNYQSKWNALEHCAENNLANDVSVSIHWAHAEVAAEMVDNAFEALSAKLKHVTGVKLEEWATGGFSRAVALTDVRAKNDSTRTYGNRLFAVSLDARTIMKDASQDRLRMPPTGADGKPQSKSELHRLI